MFITAKPFQQEYRITPPEDAVCKRCEDTRNTADLLKGLCFLCRYQDYLDGKGALFIVDLYREEW